jgi:general secretion pathway protein I
MTFKKTFPFRNCGFTLIEVLLALAVIAIAFTALLKTTAQDVAFTRRIKEKTIHHWVALQGVHMIQLGLLPLHQEVTEKTNMLGETWYWRAQVTPTPLKSLEKICITVSKRSSGPFSSPLWAYRYVYASGE